MDPIQQMIDDRLTADPNDAEALLMAETLRNADGLARVLDFLAAQVIAALSE